jgi:alpha-tubulin suppressor-like RCC1 family protein
MEIQIQLILIIISSPNQVGTANNWKSVINGTYQKTALKTDGTLWAWGANSFGQLGNGNNDNTNPNNYIPTQVGTASNWKSVSAGSNFNIALKIDGTLWAWGSNEIGQLGDGTTINRYSPIQIGIANNWIVASTYTSSCFAIKTDGTLWAWGFNGYGGQLGDGTTTNLNTPTQIGTANNWKNISSGIEHRLALKTDGTIWSWGANSYGQLGNGNNDNTNPNNYIPTQAGTASNWKSVSAGNGHSFAIKTDGTLWAWGRNYSGQLGDGTNVDKYVPIQIGTSNNWKQVTAGNGFSTALKTDGTIWACGRNDFGQLGDGTTIDKNILTQVSCTSLDTELFEKNSLKLYPNPVLCFLNVKTDNNLINQPYTIIDGLGRVVINGKLNEVESSINVEQLSKGIYYLKVSGNNVSKFVKE